MTMKPQQCNSIVPTQHQHQHNNRMVEQQFVLPSTTTTMIGRDNKDGGNGHNTAVTDKAVIKQVMHTQVVYYLITLPLQPRVARDSIAY